MWSLGILVCISNVAFASKVGVYEMSIFTDSPGASIFNIPSLSASVSKGLISKSLLSNVMSLI